MSAESNDQTDSEARDSQLSAMFDGELPAGECELVARRLSRDENLRRSWGHYALIGAALRGEPTSARVATRVRAGLASTVVATAAQTDADGVSLPTQRRAGMAARWAWPLGAGGVAAGVALVAIFSLRAGPDSAGGLDPLVAEQVVVDQVVAAPASLLMAERQSVPVRTERVPSEPESYVTPSRGGSGGPAIAVEPQLAQFVMAHSAVTPPMVRHGALSMVVAPESVAATASESSAGSAAPQPEAAAAAEVVR